MAKAPLQSHFYIKIGGTDASEELMRGVTDVLVESSLHLPDVATLTIHDPGLRWIDETLLEPGKEIEISTAPNEEKGRPSVIFDGEIVELEPEFTSATHRLVARAFDRLHRLSRGRFVRSFMNVTDSDVVQRIAKEAGLEPDVEPTKRVYEYVLQNNETNFEFLRKRAAAASCLLYAEGKKLCFKPLQAAEQAIELKWGFTLNEFRPRLSTISQVNSVDVRGWDPSTRSELHGHCKSEKASSNIAANNNGGQVSQTAFKMEASHLVTTHPIRTQAEADDVAKMTSKRLSERFIAAEGICPGNPKIVAGARLKLEGLGDKFTGTYFVTSARHVFSSRQEYRTYFQTSGDGQATLFSALRGDATERPVNTSALAIGIVTDNNDPQGWGRVKVKFPWLSAEHTSDWARVIAIGGGAQRGIQFLPEVNDEVLVGFEMGDVHHAYVLGGLWNGKDKPPIDASAAVKGGNVQQRMLCSRRGHTILFDDSTSGGGITIEDKGGNRIQWNARDKKIVLQSKGDMDISADGNLTLKATGQIQIGGNGATLDGGASTVTVTGTLIKLN
ncbi:MAG: VgrG-related protein [Alloacidobacterium sp.]